MKTCGIYAIKNNLNNKLYIGSSKNIEKRFLCHLNYLKKNKHENSYLQRSYNIDPNCWETDILQICLESELLFYEQSWIDSYSRDQLYNLNLIASKPPGTPIGSKLTEEHKRKISESSKGRRKTQEEKLKMSLSKKGKKGKPWTQECKLKQKENLHKLGQTFCKPIICHNIINDDIFYFKSIKIAAKRLLISERTITNILIDKTRRSQYPYIFEYVTKYELLQLN